MNIQNSSLEKTISIINKYRIFFICWIVIMSLLYFDNLYHYPNSIVDNQNMSNLYGFFDYVRDYSRESEALDWARKNGTYEQAKFVMDLGFEFTRPVFSLWKFMTLLSVPIIYLLIWFQISLFIKRPVELE